MQKKIKYGATNPFDEIQKYTVWYDNNVPVIFTEDEEDTDYRSFDSLEYKDFMLSVLSDTEEECKKKIEQFGPNKEEVRKFLKYLDFVITRSPSWQMNEILSEYGDYPNILNALYPEDKLTKKDLEIISKALASGILTDYAFSYRIEEIIEASQVGDNYDILLQSGNTATIYSKGAKFVIRSIFF